MDGLKEGFKKGLDLYLAMLPDCPITETMIPDCQDCNGCPYNLIVDWKRKLNISSDLEVLTTPPDVGRLYDSMDYIMCTDNVYYGPLVAA